MSKVIESIIYLCDKCKGSVSSCADCDKEFKLDEEIVCTKYLSHYCRECEPRRREQGQNINF
jgi:hypothetical protein